MSDRSPSGRPFLLGAGLKMYLGHAESVRWAAQIRAACAEHPALTNGHASLLVLPSFVSLEAVARELAGSSISIGGQDLSDHRRGPFTGEVSADDLVAVGCSFVEIGHAERRARHGETDAAVAAKTAVAVSAGLTPVICVGERDQGSAEEAALFCRAQVRDALATASIGPGTPLAIAYEPIWAIGAPEPADAAHIAEVCRALEGELGAVAAEANSTVIYGGSARPGMVAELDASVRGLFMGRASHDAQNVAAVLDEVMERVA